MCGARHPGFSVFLSFPHPIGRSLNDDGLGVVEHAIKNGGGDGDIAIKDVGPFLEGFIGRDDGGTALIAMAEDLKEQVGAKFVDGQVPEFINLC